jgi:putative DNA-invertase from lambdoid prophage Rac
MPNFYAYLRVSTGDQTTEAQRLGLLEYANSRSFAPLHIEEETASRAKDWRKRKLGRLVDRAQRGDVILTPEFSRLGGSALAVLEFLQAASERGIVVHVTKQQVVMDGSLQSEIMATVLGLAAQIERHFIRTRTREALQLARERGKTIGRPQGSTATHLKLDDRIDEIRGYLALGLSKAHMARLLKCDPKTLREFVKRRKLKAAPINNTNKEAPREAAAHI